MIDIRTSMSLLAVACAAALPADLRAQAEAVDVSYGRWWYDGAGSATSLSATWRRDLLGPVNYGLGVVHLSDQSVVSDRTMTGGEVSVRVGGFGTGPYAVGSVGLGMRHNDGNLDALWSAGAGYALRPVSFLRVGLEARYRVEDSSSRGFWQLESTDRRGLMLQGGMAIHFGRSAQPAPHWGTSVAAAPPARESIDDLARNAGATEGVAARAASVVNTALDVMGTPYRWGGTDENGFDCSGLIQYAYGQHGIILPRISRDQAGTGVAVQRHWHQLQPGDILGFAVEGRRVTHVGLYVGDGQFIHSASGGVSLSSLTSSHPEDRWWQERWVVARRVLGE
jgi:cell wall-associated NlpC family hydrolase